ncbi:flagellar basal body P-ring formation chaperone FlgA [Amaricoccus sp.]|uniref:flagellar basal body P-ring formation chaperone FlgA n=1 Tax=Amaricoccus sp. TaxID=1872485 RepID=UPI0026249AE6|nr:flagellar basal body P-ring formation chaperone FlgA [uncultured Amaricoccus sp.]
MAGAALLLAALTLLPVAAAAQTVVPARPIRAQTLISEADLTVTDETTPGAFADIGAVVGREARATLYTGRPILESQIGSPAVIARNQLVRMTFADGPLTIVTEGRALDRAGVGEPARVMNLTSKQIVTGVVAANGSIEVTK